MSNEAELKALNDRIEALQKESKEFRAKYTDASSKLEQFETEIANKSGDIAKKLELAEKKAKQLEEENKIKTNKIVDQNIRSIIAGHAKDAHSVDDILNLPEIKKMISGAIDKDSLSINEEIAKEAVAKAFELRPHFKKVVATETVHTDKPKVTTTTNDTEDLSKLSASEVKAKMLKIGQ